MTRPMNLHLVPVPELLEGRTLPELRQLGSLADQAVRDRQCFSRHQMAGHCELEKDHEGEHATSQYWFSANPPNSAQQQSTRSRTTWEFN
jgi:hypothetical protein